MKKLILSLAFALAFSSPAFAWKAQFSVTASGGAPIPTNFSASNSQSHVLTGLVNVTELCVFNDTGTRVILDTVDWASAPATDTHKIPAYGFVCVRDNISSDVSIRGESSITAGEVYGFAR
jgi:hypothetical protein